MVAEVIGVGPHEDGRVTSGRYRRQYFEELGLAPVTAVGIVPRVLGPFELFRFDLEMVPPVSLGKVRGGSTFVPRKRWRDGGDDECVVAKDRMSFGGQQCRVDPTRVGNDRPAQSPEDLLEVTLLL